MAKVYIVGAGAAGLMAAYSAASAGHSVVVLEQNEKPGKKLYITGKGRCNLCNESSEGILFSNIIRNRKFLYSSIYTFNSDRVMQFFQDQGLPLKTERGNRVFPVSDHSSDVIKALVNAVESAGAVIEYYAKVIELTEKEKKISGIIYEKHHKRIQKPCDAVILACGGVSYPSTGSDGSGYILAEQMGHHLTELRPALVPMETKEDYLTEMQGLSLKNVRLSVFQNNKKLYSGFGEMMFTHFGITGPLVLTASSQIPDKAFECPMFAEIDLKPAVSSEQLDKRIQKIFADNVNKQFKNAIHKLLPAKMLPILIRLSRISEDKKVNEITKEERHYLIHLIKNFPITITGLRSFKEAIITRGGIAVKDINPSTMESKLISNLYVTGEMLDTDALTGGFNLQIAWSTGYLAGLSVHEKEEI